MKHEQATLLEFWTNYFERGEADLKLIDLQEQYGKDYDIVDAADHPDT
jgi:hypothetical protein